MNSLFRTSSRQMSCGGSSLQIKLTTALPGWPRTKDPTQCLAPWITCLSPQLCTAKVICNPHQQIFFSIASPLFPYSPLEHARAFSPPPPEHASAIRSVLQLAYTIYQGTFCCTFHYVSYITTSLVLNLCKFPFCVSILGCKTFSVHSAQTHYLEHQLLIHKCQRTCMNQSHRNLEVLMLNSRNSIGNWHLCIFPNVLDTVKLNIFVL